MHRGFRRLARDLGVRFPKMPPCDACKRNKMTRNPFPASEGITTTAAGQKTHVDTLGPMCDPLYYDGCRYLHCFSDDYSDVTLGVWAMDRTTATFIEACMVWYALLRSLGVTVVGEILSDGAPEFVSRAFFDFCDEHALQRLLSVRYCPQLNGKAVDGQGCSSFGARKTARDCTRSAKAIGHRVKLVKPTAQ